MAIQWDTATEHEIVQHCLRSNPDRKIISELDGGLSLIRISEEAVVKCGFNVTQFEATNQLHAYEILNPAIIRVPRVHRFFQSGLKGYLIMEYIEGQPLSSSTDPDNYLESMAKVLKLFEHVQRATPGPLHESFAFGQLWLDYDPIAPATILDIEEYYNKRQLKNSTNHIKLASYPLVFCHLDLGLRNIIVSEDGSLCLVDWYSAGFYPRLFERTALRINVRKENDWNTKLLGLLGELDEGEKFQARLLEQTYYLGQKYI
jgi:serine/threonine protein kinase